MRKTYIVCLFLAMTALCCGKAYGQKPPAFAIHIASPIALVYKFGVKVEWRPYYDHAFLLSFNQYYKYYPGYQGAFEYRMYFHAHNSVHENIIYFKAGNGFADFKEAPSFAPTPESYSAPGTYYFGGAGIGRHFNFGNFFLDLCAGLKYSYVVNPPKLYDERLFYSIGPGSIPDVHFTFGLQL